MTRQAKAFFLLFLVQYNTKTSCIKISTRMSIEYSRCPAGSIFNGQPLGSAYKRSKLDCLVQCSQRVDCMGVNVCPTTASRRIDCTLLNRQNPSMCHGLDQANSTSCFFAQRRCLNGGRPGDKACVCTGHFIGDFCERYARDCKEAYYNGWSASSNYAPLFIQPLTASTPFKVYCVFMYGGMTIPFHHNGLTFDIMDWTQAKHGQYKTSEHFFVGLENLRHLLIQAEYSLGLTFWNGTNIYGYWYANFSVAPESDSYELGFSTHRPANDSNRSGNFFLGISQLVFSTQDRDIYGCVNTHGSPSWYGPGCNGYSLFADQLMVPIDGEGRRMNIGGMYLSRDTNFRMN